MPWENLVFKWPDSIERLYTDVNAMQSNINNELDNVSTRLNDIPSPEFSASTLAQDSAGAFDRYQQLYTLINYSFYSVVVHPWLDGDINGTLSAPNALTQLTEATDSNTLDSELLKNNKLDAVSLLLPARTLNELFEVLTTVSNIFPLTELLKLKRRAQQLVQLEDNQFTIPAQAKKTQWHRGGIMATDSITDALKPLINMLAVSSSAENESNPIDDLQKLIDRKKNKITQLNNVYQYTRDVFNGGRGYVMTLSGSINTIKNSLLSTPSIGHDYPYCVGVLFLAEENQLAVLKELFSAA